MSEVKIFCDGASRGNPGLAGAGFIIFDKSDKEIARGSKFLEIATNNFAEWSALLLALEKAKALDIKEAICYMDSLLVIEQAKGNYKVKNPELQKLNIKLFNLRSSFSKLSFVHIPREKNGIADSLANEAIDKR